ncbi:MAG: hypothetical protein F4164_08155 [Gemmatimonadales bacterium]|nr:hypothetical protein [Gemmatimonadales bacterium]MYG49329.1 hypothetical protein [Gemmatimonadales bacterium]MYK03024.1 hypothetical protein [Candidatus Palauibacter ramosifaciens]
MWNRCPRGLTGLLAPYLAGLGLMLAPHPLFSSPHGLVPRGQARDTPAAWEYRHGASAPAGHPAPDGAMGAIGGIVIAAEGDWPGFSREHPDYVQDLRNTLEKPNEAAHAHGSDGDSR